MLRRRRELSRVQTQLSDVSFLLWNIANYGYSTHLRKILNVIVFTTASPYRYNFKISTLNYLCFQFGVVVYKTFNVSTSSSITGTWFVISGSWKKPPWQRQYTPSTKSASHTLWRSRNDYTVVKCSRTFIQLNHWYWSTPKTNTYLESSAAAQRLPANAFLINVLEG